MILNNILTQWWDFLLPNRPPHQHRWKCVQELPYCKRRNHLISTRPPWSNYSPKPRFNSDRVPLILTHASVMNQPVPNDTVTNCGFLVQTTRSVWSAGSRLSATSPWATNGPRTCKRAAGRSCASHTASCATSTTTGTAAPSSAGPETMRSDTSPAGSAERSCATPAGRGSTALSVSGFAHQLRVHVKQPKRSHRRTIKGRGAPLYLLIWLLARRWKRALTTRSVPKTSLNTH